MTEPGHSFYEKISGSQNFLLMKAGVGQTRPGFHILPERGFAYGLKSGEDQEGVADVISTWRFHENSKALPNEQDFKLLNSRSVANGLFTARQFRDYKKRHPLRLESTRSRFKPASIPNDSTFGNPLRPATPIKAVISNFYGRVSLESLNSVYSEVPQVQHCRFGSTKGAELLKKSIRKNMQKKVYSEFKMKKFNAIKTRTSCWRK